MKTVNVIFYVPGFAGNFLQLVLSLDKRTCPHIPFDTILEDESQRKNLYSFKSLQDPSKLWLSHHLQFKTPMSRFKGESNYDTVVFSIHPLHFDSGFINYAIKYENVSRVNYLSVHASEHVLKEHIFGFIERNGGFPKYREEHVNRFNEIVEEYDTFKINLDMMFSTEQDFLLEYKRISDHLGLEYLPDDAVILYRDWRNSRNITRTHKKITDPEVLDEVASLYTNYTTRNSLTHPTPN